MTTPYRHRLWAELNQDSHLRSLRYGTLGWVPRKRERITGIQDKFALCVLRHGSAGTFHTTGTTQPEPVRGPGVFFVTPGGRHDYGVIPRQGHWEEFYWILEGARVEEWLQAGWWDRTARFWPVSPAVARTAWELFQNACLALERRDQAKLDRNKLALERWLSEGPWAIPEPTKISPSPLAAIVEMWRRDLARRWSLAEAARLSGLSYTRFRARFASEYEMSPYAYLIRLRLELSRRWLRSTDEPVKAIAARCGFTRVETFIRAFTQSHGKPPNRWRLEQTAVALSRRKKR